MPPKKQQKRNIGGLRNQPKQPSLTRDHSPVDSDDESTTGVHFDSMRVDWEHEDESDVESEVDLDDFGDEEFGVKLAEMVEKEDAKDLDWLPPRLRVKLQERKGAIILK
jgi:hypothetical protein